MPGNKEKTEQEKFDELFDALSRPEPPQDQKGKRGDPQLAALTQFLLAATEKQDSVIVDYGCGNGVLPNIISDIYADTQDALPEFWAVDLPEPLDKLALSSAIHNKTKKIPVSKFYSHELPANGVKITSLVVRNVLHEMTISETAVLFKHLLSHLSPRTDIYIQDMEHLPKAERGNPPWNFSLLKACLEEIGFSVQGRKLESYSGIPWFALVCHVPEKYEKKDLTDIISRYRAKQLHGILEKAKDITKDYEKTNEIINYSLDTMSLNLQLKEVGWFEGAHEKKPGLDLPFNSLINSDSTWAVAANKEIAKASGLVALLSTKNLLDFPTLINNAKEEIMFGGYSNRPLFKSEENKSALIAAVKRGVRLSVMVVDPESTAAKLRSEEPLYSDPAAFIESINQTMIEGAFFYQSLVDQFGTDDAKRFEMKSSSRNPKWSYFIIDDRCYLSFYSIDYSGSAAPCFVFQNMAGAIHNYFHVVRKEFLKLFTESQNILS